MNQIHTLRTWKVLLLISVFSALTPVISGSMLLKKTTQRRREANTSNPRARLQRVKAESRKRYLKKKHKKPHVDTKYNACMSYTCEQLKSLWIFGGKMPSCGGCVDDAYYYTDDGGEGNTGGGGGSGTENNTTDDANSGGNTDDTNNGGNTDDAYSGGSTDDTNTGGNTDDTNTSGGTDDTNTSSSTDDTTASATDDANGGGATDDGTGGGATDDNNANSGGSDDNVINNNGGQDNYFNVSRCETYSNYWLWDLALSCESSQNLTACECTTAAQLMDDGELSCPDGSDENPYCPNDCEICDTCMQMLGCQNTKPNNATRSTVKWNMLIYIIAAVGAIMLGVVAVILHHRGDKREPLLANENDDNVWLAPVSD